MNKQTLLRTQRNLLLQGIVEAGLPPVDFAWQEVPSKHDPSTLISRLEHAPTSFYFNFDYLRGKHWTEFSPGSESLVESAYPGNWQHQFDRVSGWLNQLRREVDEPDLWEMISAERQLVLSATTVSLDNSPFSADELRRIGTNVNELLEYIQATTKLTQIQLEYITDRLAHLEESAARLGRKDWITLAVGAITNIIVGVALAPEAARDLLRTANGLLGWVANALLTLPK